MARCPKSLTTFGDVAVVKAVILFAGSRLLGSSELNIKHQDEFEGGLQC
jgi:hypothetical protein